ncbi:exported hypothetical protein [Verrucomicrobia bacterium]|nr:exported hypothetical protein [Verrucomicrobiota bacterium]
MRNSGAFTDAPLITLPARFSQLPPPLLSAEAWGDPLLLRFVVAYRDDAGPITSL